MPMKRFKYQALVTLVSPADDGAAVPPGSMRRMVVEARHHENGGTKLFSALVSGDPGPPPGGSQILVTLRVTGDDTLDYLCPGDVFGLWREGHVGDGMVTRRLFV